MLYLNLYNSPRLKNCCQYPEVYFTTTTINYFCQGATIASLRTKADTKGREVEDLIDQSSLVVLSNKESTCIPDHGNQRQSSPDISLVSEDIFLEAERNVLKKRLSNHLPILVSIRAVASAGKENKNAL